MLLKGSAQLPWWVPGRESGNDVLGWVSTFCPYAEHISTKPRNMIAWNNHLCGRRSRPMGGAVRNGRGSGWYRPSSKRFWPIIDTCIIEILDDLDLALIPQVSSLRKSSSSLRLFEWLLEQINMDIHILNIDITSIVYVSYQGNSIKIFSK